MKLYFKLVFLLTALFTPSVEAFQVMNDDIKSLDFNEVTSCLKNRRPLKIGGKEYAVCEKEPEFKGKVMGYNPCYKWGIGPRLLKESDLKLLPSPLPSFTVLDANTDEKEEYLTVSFTSHNHPDWQDMCSPLFCREGWYWNQSKDGAVTTRYVSFMLKKIP